MKKFLFFPTLSTTLRWLQNRGSSIVKQKLKVFVTIGTTFYFLLAQPVFALTPGTGPGGLPPGRPITLTDLDYIIFRVSTFFITVSGVLALIFIIWSGITYMYAGDDTKKVDSAKARLRSGIIGAAIVFGVGVIIQTIASVVTLDFFCTVRVPIIGTCLY
ncbi:MAG: hypothetical protein AAB799_01995 [Patescibacteria group bacterium]